MISEKFDINKIEVKSKEFETGFQLQCICGDERLAGPFFSRESDVKEWVNLFNHVMDLALNENKSDDYDDIVTERDSLLKEKKMLTDALSEKSLKVNSLLKKIDKLTDSQSALKLENRTLSKKIDSFEKVYNSFAKLFDEKIEEVDTPKSVDDVINDFGGIEALKECCMKGSLQRTVAKEIGVSPASVCTYIRSQGESWKDWIDERDKKSQSLS